VYPWIWRKLPGGLPGKLLGSLALLIGVLALLFFVVFPWVEPRLPYNDVNVDQGPVATVTPTATPSLTPTVAPSASATLPGG
jgi:hypothetical protein